MTDPAVPSPLEEKRWGWPERGASPYGWQGRPLMSRAGMGRTGGARAFWAEGTAAGAWALRKQGWVGHWGQGSLP